MFRDLKGRLRSDAGDAKPSYASWATILVLSVAKRQRLHRLRLCQPSAPLV